MKLNLLIIFHTFLLFIPQLYAEVASTTIEEITKKSDYIVIGKVVEINNVNEIRVAKLEVTENIKGKTEKILYFLAQSTWTCDISWAEENEEVLLFLEKYEFDPNPQNINDNNKELFVLFKEPKGFKEKIIELSGKTPFLEIIWSGRGRMPLRYINHDTFVTLWTDDVILPKDAITIDGPEEEYKNFIRSVALNYIKSLIKKYL